MRIDELRADVRRAGAARRERASSSPARLLLPLASAVLVIGAAAVVSSALGLPPTAVLAITLGVALLGAFVAHRTVLSVLAGLTLLVVRPYAPGERVRLQAADGAFVEAEVIRVGLANTALATDTGVLVVPNNRLLQGAPPSASAARAEKSMQA
jgi:small-conductance mechanosensitive channel